MAGFKKKEIKKSQSPPSLEPNIPIHISQQPSGNPGISWGDYISHCSAAYDETYALQKCIPLDKKLVCWRGLILEVKHTDDFGYIKMNFEAHNEEEVIITTDIKFSENIFKTYNNKLYSGSRIDVRLRLAFEDTNITFYLDPQNGLEIPDLFLTFSIFFHQIYDEKVKQAPSIYYEKMFNSHKIVMIGYVSDLEQISDPSFNIAVNFTPKASPWMKYTEFGMNDPIKLLVLKNHTDLLFNLRKAVEAHEQMNKAILNRTQINNSIIQSRIIPVSNPLQYQQIKEPGLLCEICAVFILRGNPEQLQPHYLQLFGINSIVACNPTNNTRRSVSYQEQFRTDQEQLQLQSAFSKARAPSEKKPKKVEPRIQGAFANFSSIKKDDQQTNNVIGYEKLTEEQKKEYLTDEYAKRMGYIMLDPVRGSDGMAYEREQLIEEFKKADPMNPETQKPLKREFIPDEDLKLRIQAFIKMFPGHPLNRS
ncbi:MAG: hypothetical protein EZS28_031220 [Streblomastix strix]|uniref:U-box domain-containing protein n=1 Tax=Streblomastix strix TaxID=222440 RepID=A0A5J4USQ4_9EUKA|nr:MAG: hypothetical protein EZS28_031220 [Streblomastix strix]